MIETFRSPGAGSIILPVNGRLVRAIGVPDTQVGRVWYVLYAGTGGSENLYPGINALNVYGTAIGHIFIPQGMTDTVGQVPQRPESVELGIDFKIGAVFTAQQQVGSLDFILWVCDLKK